MAVIEQAARRSAPGTSLIPLTSGLITAATCPPAVTEAYVTLSTNLQFALLGTPGTVIMGVPIDDSVDGAQVMANLALAMAGSGDAVLAVDCNLHQPSLHTAFGLSNEQGLRHLFSGEWSDQPDLAQQGTLPNLRVLAAGPGNPGVLSHAATNDMAEAIGRLKETADRLLLLGPPLMGYADALALAPNLDGLVLIVSAHRTRRKTLTRARELLARANAPLIGAVLLDSPRP